jgi:transcriptional repressor NrdR
MTIGLLNANKFRNGPKPGIGFVVQAARLQISAAGEPALRNATGLDQAMKCPFCREGDFAVIDSRSVDGGFPVRRRRVCDRCKRRVWTIEHVEEVPLKVVKKNDSRREPFDPAKLRSGLEKACYKRPVTDEQIETMVREIENDLYARYFGEVAASVIGDLVMERLRKLDQVAYVRFASVYREFQDVSEFVQEVKPMLRGAKNGNSRRRTR